VQEPDAQTDEGGAVVTGKQTGFGVRGAQNEAVACDLIGRLSAPVKVPREHDFGADFFCQLYAPGEGTSVGVSEIFALQVKSESEELAFGGLRDQKWRDYEIAWLRTLAVPLLLGRVNATTAELRLYSLSPMWRVLWQTAQPFKITCSTEPPTSDGYERPDPTSGASGHVHGDGLSWTVPLGPPILKLTHASIADGRWLAAARDLLRWHVQLERRNLTRFHLRVAVHQCLQRWSSDDFTAQFAVSTAMFWSSVPGENLAPLADMVAQAIVNLGVNLQWQNNRDAYRLIDALEWLQDVGALDSLGRSLLDGLRITRAQGLGPSEPGVAAGILPSGGAP
jgi:hypothetical protein